MSDLAQPASDAADRPDDDRLPGTVKRHERHLVVLTDAADWPARIETQPGLAAALMQHIASHDPPLPAVKVTVATGNTCARGHDVLVFPDMIRYREVTADDCAILVEDHLADGQICARLTSDVLTGRHLFVCVHAARDDRCGAQGPPLAAALERELAARGIDDVTLRHSSHVGGHRFAGCLIAYPSGDWYGRLDAAIAGSFVEHCMVGDRILTEHWRGRLGQSAEQQLAAAQAWGVA